MKSLVILKPDAIHRNLFKEFCEYIKEHEFEIDNYEIIHKPSIKLIDAHYSDHITQDWYAKLRRYMSTGPIILIAIDCADLAMLNKLRHISLLFRAKYQINHTYNTIHCSDSEESAIKELNIWGKYDNE